MEPYKRIEYRGATIGLYHDEYAESPKDWDNEICFIIYDHRDFTVQVPGYDPNEIFWEYWNEGEDRIPEYWIFPVYALIHSGIWLSLGKDFGCDPGGWDTSFKGFILRKRKRGLIKKYARRDAQMLLDSWNKYLSGEVCGYAINDGKGDSCWGFYEEKYAIEQAKESIDLWHEEAHDPIIPVTS